MGIVQKDTWDPEEKKTLRRGLQRGKEREKGGGEESQKDTSLKYCHSVICGELNENSLHRSICLNVWSPVSGTI